MQQVLFRPFRLGVLILLALGGGTQSPALAESNFNHHLRGDYRATWSASCVSDPVGFDDNLKAMGGGSSVIPITFSGLFHYNGNGTGTAELSRLTFTGNPTQPILEVEGNCTLSYKVNADGTFTQTLNCTSTILKGSSSPGVTQIITETGMRLDGTFGTNFLPLVLALHTTDPTPFVVSRTFPPPAPTTVQKRICGFSGSAVLTHLDGRNQGN